MGLFEFWCLALGVDVAVNQVMACTRRMLR